MNIFDHLNNILFSKSKSGIDNIDDESDFNQFMINRWCSMYSPHMAIIINNTTNWLYNTFETKQDYYKFLIKVLPRVKFKRIHYIKKTKVDKETEIENLGILSKRLELSKREIKSYYEFQNSCTTRTSESLR